MDGTATTPATTPAPTPAEVGLSPPGVLRRVLGHPGLVAGIVLLGFCVAMAVLAPLLAPHDPYAQNLTQRLIPPVWYEKGSWAHPLGTDNLGRDYLSRTLYGARISLLIGLSVMLISGLIGTRWGSLPAISAGASISPSTSSSPPGSPCRWCWSRSPSSP